MIKSFTKRRVLYRKGRWKEDLQHEMIQADNVGLGVQQVEVLQRLGQPERLHLIDLRRRGIHHVVDSGVRDARGRVRLDGLEHVPAALGPVLLAGDAPEDEDGLDGLGAEEVSSVVGLGEARGEALVVDLLAHGDLVRGRVDGFEPRLLVPGALVLVVAGYGAEGLGHDSRGGVLVSPDAAVGEAPAVCEICWPVEDLACDGEHASCEARQVLHVGDDFGQAVRPKLQATGEQDVPIADVHGAEDEILLCHVDEVFVHGAVLLEPPAEHHVLLEMSERNIILEGGVLYLWQVLVRRVC